jgi:hypothetical protein
MMETNLMFRYERNELEMTLDINLHVAVCMRYKYGRNWVDL